MHFNQISPTEFNLISPIEFNLISPVGSNQKRFAKSTRISTRFHPLNSTRFQLLVSTLFHRLDPTKNGLQNLHVFQPDFTVGINQISKSCACWVVCPTAVFIHYWHTQLPCTQGTEPYVPNGCVH